MRILIVEDEIKILQFTTQTIKVMGHAADGVTSGQEARSLFIQYDYDLVILDLMLADDHGIKMCQFFKLQKPQIPIMILTTLNRIHDKVNGLDSGADDYMTKPFMVEEFSARVRALLRRNLGHSNILKCSDMEMNVTTREVFRSGKLIKLTNKQYALLEFLMRNLGRTLTRPQIAQHVWDQHYDSGSNVVDVYVKEIRKKIDFEHHKKLIKTIIGVGYVLSEE